MGPARTRLLADDALRGAAWCRAHSALVDAWLADLYAAAEPPDRTALVAVGGYGRSELSPHSDIDVYLLHSGADVAAVADAIWYPVWDADIHLGHKVCTIREALRLATSDLTTATALLTARHVAGDPSLTSDLVEATAGLWARHARHWLADLGAQVDLRHAQVGEVAFAIEPDLKEGRGGLRDVHALAWASAAQPIPTEDTEEVAGPYEVLLSARVELQRNTGRPVNVLALQDQAAVASALGDANEDACMTRIATAARTIAWISDDAWRRIRSASRGPLGRLGRRTRSIGDGLRLVDGEVTVDTGDVLTDPALAIRAAVVAARQGTAIERASLARMAAAPRQPLEQWSPATRHAFVQLLLAGRASIGPIEALDHVGIWARYLPEWDGVRARAQRNPYHRFTVDRHLLETVANAASLAARVERPDLLVVGALLHDIGKGSGRDHTEAGVEIVARIAARMGFDASDRDVLAQLVRLHLLLPDVALRRDLDDPATARRVAEAVGTAGVLSLLWALTEADATATGPSAWGPWKAQLVEQLVSATSAVLEGSEPPRSAQVLHDAGADDIAVNGDVITVVTTDRPGSFSRVAGVLALHGLDVLTAVAHPTPDGRGLSRFRVTDRVRDDIPWDRVVTDLRLALAGRLALSARLADRARTYRRRQLTAAIPPRVTFDIDASADATVVDVEAEDAVGVLYAITRALAELDLDVRSARVQTLGPRLVDAFYVQDTVGDKVTDPVILAEIERAILHALPRP